MAGEPTAFLHRSRRPAIARVGIRGPRIQSFVVLERVAPSKVEPEMTPQQKTIVGLVPQGLDRKRIGTKLANSEKTVRHQLNQIFAKFDVERRS